jgi:bacteriochlorophyll 4-vinyl reductase
MVPEADVSDLYRTLRLRLDAAEAEAEGGARLAGDKTAAYVLANRIPRAAQMLLRLLPPRFAAPVLLSSITKHMWTFAGSGTVRIVRAASPRIAIEGCPICRGSSAWAVVRLLCRIGRGIVPRTRNGKSDGRRGCMSGAGRERLCFRDSLVKRRGRNGCSI